MALINCPECGKENVSDQAAQCPNCGYDIKKHFQEIQEKKRLTENRRYLERKIIEQTSALKPELDEKLQEIDGLPHPKKPSFLTQLFSGDGAFLTNLALGTTVISFLLSLVTGSVLFVTIFVLALVLGIPFILYINALDYQSSKHLYQEQIADWEKYKQERKNKLIQDYETYARNLALYGSRTSPNIDFVYKTSDPKCPICSSSDIKKITLTRRMASVYVAGAASSDIGKQMQCNKCGYKF